MKKLLMLFAISLLTACAPKFEGTYSNGNGKLYFTFKPDGKVLSNFGTIVTGKELEGTYQKDGDTIKIRFPKNDNREGTEVVWKMNDSGSINAGIMGVLVKK
jgi:hypothetical protein